MIPKYKKGHFSRLGVQQSLNIALEKKGKRKNTEKEEVITTRGFVFGSPSKHPIRSNPPKGSEPSTLPTPPKLTKPRFNTTVYLYHQSMSSEQEIEPFFALKFETYHVIFNSNVASNDTFWPQKKKLQ